MKKKIILGLIATATVSALISAPTLASNQNTSSTNYKVLLTQTNSAVKTNEAVVINGNNKLNLYTFSNGKGVNSYLSTGEMLTILGSSNGYYKVRVHETGAVGYIDSANMKIISNCENCELTSLDGQASIINVSAVVNLRQSAGINSSVIGTLTNGESVKLLAKQGDWFKVNANGTVGFIYGEYIGTAINSSNNNTSANNSTSSSKNNNDKSSVANSSNAQSNIDNKGTNNSTSQNSNNNVINKIAYIANVGPNTEYPFIDNTGYRSKVFDGQQVKILGEKGDLYKIVYKDGSENVQGYINKKYITFENNQNQTYPNDNKFLSKYFGTWTVGKQIGSTIGEDVYVKSFEGKKLIITKDLYSFNGRTIKNPNYYIVPKDRGVFFGNSKYDNFGDLKYNKNGEVEFIIALPSSEKVTNKDYMTKLQNLVFDYTPVMVSGDKLVTFGGGLLNTSLNECVRGDIKMEAKIPDLSDYIGKGSTTLNAGYIYSKPDTDSSKTSIPASFNAVTKKIEGNWIYVESNQNGKTIEGWIPLDNLKLTDYDIKDMY